MLPPVSKVIIGVPQASASKLVVGKLSSDVGLANTSADEYISVSSSTLFVLLIPMMFCGNWFNCLSFNPTKTILLFSSINFDSSRKYLKPFLSSQIFATPNIINLSLILYFFLNSLPLLGLNTSKSMPLFITFTSYSFKNDCFTKSASHLEGVITPCAKIVVVGNNI
jgi:hypothetical protein